MVASALLMTLGCPAHGAHSANANTASVSANLTPGQASSVHPAHHTAHAPRHHCCRDTPHATAVPAHPPSIATHPGAPAELGLTHPARSVRTAAAIPDRPPRHPGALLPNAMVARR